MLPWRSAQENRPRGWWDDQDRRDKETPVSAQSTLLVLGDVEGSHHQCRCALLVAWPCS